jgi:CubicO group peptidase (beta-lactamase class C family)
LRLDDPAELYLPELGQVTYPFPDASRITLRHLLTHTSGLPRLGDFDYTRPDRSVTEAELLWAVSRARLESAPGTAFVYSNFGMSLAGLIAARRAPEGALRAAMTARVLAPLGMARTTFDPRTLPGAQVATGYAGKAKPDPAPPWQLGASEAAGGLWSSADDMGRWVAYQLQAWPPRAAPDTGPLRRASLRELHTLTFPFGFEAHRGAERAEASTAGIGFAWHVRQTCDYERLVEHDGAIDGFHASAAFAPDRGFGFVVLANALDARTNELMDLLLREAAPVLQPRRVQPAPEVAGIFRELGASGGACSETSYRELFTKEFREQAPFAQYRPICALLAARHGRCRYGGARRLDNPRAGDFTLTCDRGSILASARIVEEGGRPRFGALLVRSTGFPVKPELARAAQEIFGLYESWDDTRAQNLLADASAKESVRRSFASAHPNLGACRLAADSASALVGDGGDGATFPVRCERGDPLELALEVDDRGRIKGVFFSPAPPPPLPRRCR